MNGDVLDVRFKLLFGLLYDILELFKESSSCFNMSTLAELGPSSLMRFSSDIRNSSSFWLLSDKLDWAWNDRKTCQ